MEDEAVFHLDESVGYRAIQERCWQTCRDSPGTLGGQRMGDTVAIIGNLDCMVMEVDCENALDKRDKYFHISREFMTYKWEYTLYWYLRC